MTLKEFFRKARRGRKWAVRMSLSGEPQVRCDKGACPLAAVTGYWVPEAAAHKLKISTASAWKIASAADYARNSSRRWLLKNLGVQE